MKNKKTKECFNREFKLQHLGYGDWLDEPDVMEFEYRGIKCLIARVMKKETCVEEAWFGGHLCGYIFLPKEHSLYGKPMSKIDLDCHFGVTCADMTEEGYMIGFDCAHSGDLVPSMVQLRKRYTIPDMEDVFPIPENMKEHPWFKPVYRNISFCIRECKRMVRESLHFEKQASPNENG